MTDLNMLYVDELELSTRTRNGLRAMNIHTIAQFMTFPIAEFASVPKIGRASVQEVREVRDYLRQSPPPMEPPADDAGLSREARLSELVRGVNRLIDGSTLLSLRVGHDGLLELHRRIT